MFIRRTQTRNTATGESYITYRLVRGERIQGKVRQITLLNLGRHFAIAQEEWPLLCQRIEELLAGQVHLLNMGVSEPIERAAGRYVASLIARMDPRAASHGASGAAAPPVATTPQFVEVNMDATELVRPRSVGVEHVGLHALSQLGLMEKLSELGVNGVMRSAITGSIIGRMAQPASELATWRWLREQSALGELIDVDYEAMPHTHLYQASDVLMKHRDALETHIFSRTQSLFGSEETITLYDLTNTYFEGNASSNSKAKYGRSKEKRSDCLLVTLGLVLDGSGFVRRSQVLAGNVAECATLETMIKGLAAPAGALVVMDAGIASEDNLAWLVAQGYRYLVVKRGGKRDFDPTQTVSIESAQGQTIQLKKEINAARTEVMLTCHSPAKEKKDMAIVGQFAQRFEKGLQQLAEALTKPRAKKGIDHIREQIGRLKKSSRGVSRHYTIDVQVDASGKQATAITWLKTPVPGSSATHPGVYCLRSTEVDWDAEKLWRTYTMLTDLESVFRSLKSELGLRPIYHSKENRVDGHLFITVLAYQCVQVLRKQLKQADIDDSWAMLRETLSIPRRITTRFQQRDGATLHVRKSTLAEPALMRIYQALNLTTSPGGTKKRTG